MKNSVQNNEIILSNTHDFSPEHTFECGQSFRWNRQSDGSYLGVAFGKAARVSLRDDGTAVISCSEEDFLGIWKTYFDLERDYSAVRSTVAIDDFMLKACSFGCGIKLLNQEKWEVLCSFIVSQCNNIPRIKGIIERLCSLYGNSFSFEDQEYFSFPGPEIIARLKPEDLAPLKSGYRADYIINAARAVDSGGLDLNRLSKCSCDEALKALKGVRGIGDKVASCVLLFGLNKLDAFPIDVWIKRTVTQQYGENFDPAVFGPYAGIAQQYMFYYSRSGNMEV